MADTMIGRLDELTARVAGMDDRVSALERAMGRRDDAPAPLPQPARRVIEAESPSPPAAAPVLPPPLPTLSPAVGRPLPPARPAAAPIARPTLEATIGQNWTSWVGAIVVVLGVLFFLKYAWDQGWLALSPIARVMTAVGGGVAFGLAGEWVRRRGMRGLAGTLTGAGVAIVMAAFLAGHTMFDQPVFSARVAFAGVCFAAVAGVGRALRIDAVSVAIIALLGAYLAPAVLRAGRDESLVLMGYLAALAVLGWTLAYFKPRWAALRWFAWTCTGLWMTAWVVWYPMRGQHQALALATVTFFLAGFLAESFFTLHRAFRVRDADNEAAVPGFTTALENSLATLSMLSTAAGFGAFYAVLHHAGVGGAGGLFRLDPAAAIAVGLACVHAMVAFATPSKQFARSSVLQAAALVTLAVPLALGQVAITLAWLVLAVAFAALGWRRDNRAVRAWSVILLALALGRVFTLDLLDPALQAPQWNVAGQDVSHWLLLAWATAALAHLVAWLCVNPKRAPTGAPSQLGMTVAVVGTAAFFAASAMVWHGAPLTLLAIAWVAAIAALARRGGALSYAAHAAVALAVVAAKWVTLDGLASVSGSWDRPGAVMPIFNAVALSGALLIALTVWLGRRAPREGRSVAPVTAAVLFFALANFETLRAVDYFAASFADFVTAKQVALSVLWAVIGLAAVVVGFARELRPLRYAALVLLGVTLAKILFVDLAQVRPVYRILSFLAVGGLLLCVSFVYHRQNELRRTTTQG